MSTEIQAPKADPHLVLTDDHRYFYGAVEVPGVTNILAKAGLVDFDAPWFTEEARRRGTDLHAWCRRVNDGTIDWDGIPEDMLAEVEGYANWKDTAGFEVLGCEEPLYHPTRKYAGTYDTRGRIADAPSVLIDLKRGVAVPAVGVQLAGYAFLLEAEHRILSMTCKRYALHSLSRGRARVKEFTDRSDYDVFLSALNLFHWKARH
jgi:hypothetical protein